MSLPGDIRERFYQAFRDGGSAGTEIAVASGQTLSSNNSSSGPLAGSGSFIGTSEFVGNVPEITVNLYGEPSIAPGTLTFEFSPDGVNWDVSVPYTLAGPQSFVPLPLRVVLPYFRVKYVNGPTPLTAFRLTTVFHSSPAKMLTRVINQSIDENEPVENVRAFIGGKSPDGPFTNLPSTGKVTGQSSNTPLGSNASFNIGGTLTETTGFIAVAATIKADQNSATGGIKFQWYADLAGTRLLKESTFTYGTAPSGVNISVPVQGQYFRATYTNGPIAQTLFEFQVQLLVTAPPPDVLAISDTITGNNAAQIVKANIVGLQENGIYANSKLSNSGSQMVAIADRPSEVRSRTRVVIHIPRTTVPLGSVTLYTVTPGQRLYISAYSLFMLNDSASIGEWNLRDSTTNLNGFILTSRSGGTPAASTSASPSLPEPLPFSTNVNAILVTGTIFIAGFMIGYEEPI